MEPIETLEVGPSSKPRHVVGPNGAEIEVPEGWALLAPGDAALSRRIKKDGPTWTVKEKKGRKQFSKGIWAPADRVEALRDELEIERQDPTYQKKLDAGRQRREKLQAAYEVEFEAALINFLDFSPIYKDIATKMAHLITAHAIPVGSGTVARTQRIPIEKRVESATIAWMRHQTTAYDEMVIPRVKGKRREVRQMLAKRSRELLETYRKGEQRPSDCPLRKLIN